MDKTRKWLPPLGFREPKGRGHRKCLGLGGRPCGAVTLRRQHVKSLLTPLRRQYPVTPARMAKEAQLYSFMDKSKGVAHWVLGIVRKLGPGRCWTARWMQLCL